MLRYTPKQEFVIYMFQMKMNNLDETSSSIYKII